MAGFGPSWKLSRNGGSNPPRTIRSFAFSAAGTTRFTTTTMTDDDLTTDESDRAMDDYDPRDADDFERIVATDLKAVLNGGLVGLQHAGDTEPNHSVYPGFRETESGRALLAALVGHAVAPYRAGRAIGFEPDSVTTSVTPTDDDDRAFDIHVSGTHNWTATDVAVDITVRV